jgi:hypothetical protein
VPGAQLTEPLAERLRILFALSERLQVAQQRQGQVVVARPSCLDPLSYLRPFLVASWSRRFALAAA